MPGDYVVKFWGAVICANVWAASGSSWAAWAWIAIAIVLVPRGS